MRCEGEDLHLWVGVIVASQMEVARHPERAFVELVDEALAVMEEGFPL
ncbi:hypothetical protein [Gorillibacterium sp. sgz500922]